MDWKLSHRSHYMDSTNKYSLQRICLSVLPNAVAMGSGFGIYKTICSPNYLNLTYGIRSHSSKKPSGCLFEIVWPWDCRSIYFVVAHQFVTVCYRTQWKINVTLTYLNEETRENVKNLFRKWHIHLRDSPDLRCAQNNRVEGYQSENRVQNKARWTQTKDFKAVRWFDHPYYQQNYNWPIMTINKDHLPQARQMVDKKSDVGVRLEATFTDYNTNNRCKTVERT